MRNIKTAFPFALFAVLYFYVFTGERSITYYTKGDCTVTRVDYDSWGDFWTDFYYGKLDYKDIDESCCFIRCEVRGGIDCMMDGHLLFKHDSIFVVPHEGGFFKYNCNDDKLYLFKTEEYLRDEFYFTYGFSRVEEYKEYKRDGVDIIKLPTQFTLKFFNTTFGSDACSFSVPVNHKYKYVPDPCLIIKE